MRTHAIAPLAALLSLAACAPEFDGPELIQGPRIIAVKASPPEIAAPGDDAGGDPSWPGDRTDIDALVVHPDFVDPASATRAVVLHLACTPEPGDPAGTACTQMSELANPAELVGALAFDNACTDPGRGVVGRITFAGMEGCGPGGCAPLHVTTAGGPATFDQPSYALPTGLALSDALPPGHPQHVLGMDVVLLSLTLEANPQDLVPAGASAPDCASLLEPVLRRFGEEWQSRPHIISLKWIHVRGPDLPMDADSKPNQNPQVAGILLRQEDGNDVPLSGTLAAGDARKLLVDLGGDFDQLRQRFRRYDTSGVYIDTQDEDWAFSWFTTGGDLKYTHTTKWDELNELTPWSQETAMWLVVRDLRGGESWAPVTRFRGE